MNIVSEDLTSYYFDRSYTSSALTPMTGKTRGERMKVFCEAWWWNLLKKKVEIQNSKTLKLIWYSEVCLGDSVMLTFLSIIETSKIVAKLVLLLLSMIVYGAGIRYRTVYRRLHVRARVLVVKSRQVIIDLHITKLEIGTKMRLVALFATVLHNVVVCCYAIF